MQIIGGIIPIDLEIVRSALTRRARRGLSITWEDLRLPPIEDGDLETLKININKINDRIKAVWQIRWDTDPHGRDTYRFIKEVGFSRERPWFRPPRAALYLITNYGSLNSSLFHRR